MPAAAERNVRRTDEMEATLTFSEPLVRRSVWRFCARTIGWSYPFALLIVLVSFILDYVRGDRSWKIGLAGAVLSLGLVVPVILVRNQLSAALFRYRALKGKPALFRATEESFSVQSAAGSAELPWRAITAVWRYQDSWLLRLSNAQFMTFPLAGVSTDVQAFVLERVRGSGGIVA